MLYSRVLFIFHRDLRLNDNKGLLAALAASTTVVPCFIVDPGQVEKNAYRSDNAVQFMVESLYDLDDQLKKQGAGLALYYGETLRVVERLIIDHQIEAVYSNRDYTPFSRKRDAALAALCEKKKITFNVFDDALLTTPEEVKTGAGSPYTVFTPFYKKAATLSVDPVRHLKPHDYYVPRESLSVKEIEKKIAAEYNDCCAVKGGREEGLKLLQAATKNKNYDKARELPELAATTRLSAHHKFGTVSIREVYHALEKAHGKESSIIRQLYWRDFLTHIAFHVPAVFGHPFQEKFAQLAWNPSKKDFEAWCLGTTGFPIVDAGMRQLNETGFMHNRVRMIVASFLTKDLHIDWRKGEWYFATKLVDYDPSVNNGSWQWTASTGCDAQPYFRIFNPWLQQQRFDPDAVYIKRWLPELASLPAKAIHTWYDVCKQSKIDYPKPMVDHAVERDEALARYKAC